MGTIITSVVLGVLFSVVVVRGISSGIWFFTYQFVMWPMLVIYPFLILLTVAIPALLYRQIAKVSIIERLDKCLSLHNRMAASSYIPPIFNCKYHKNVVSVEVSAEVADYLEQARRNNRKLYRERQRYWDGRECDEYIIAAEGRLPYCATPRSYGPISRISEKFF